MRRVAPWVALAAVVIVTLGIVVTGGHHATHAERAHRLASEMKCPVCQGLSVADSESETSKEIAADIRRRVDAGQSDATIRAYYAAKFPGILLRPRNGGFDGLVWAIPIAVILVAAGGLAIALVRWRRAPRLSATDADRALVERVRQS